MRRPLAGVADAENAAKADAAAFPQIEFADGPEDGQGQVRKAQFDINDARFSQAQTGHLGQHVAELKMLAVGADGAPVFDRRQAIFAPAASVTTLLSILPGLGKEI